MSVAYLPITVLLGYLAYSDYKHKSINSSLLSLLVVFSIVLAFQKDNPLDALGNGVMFVGAFVLLEILTTTLIQEVIVKLFKKDKYKNAILLADGDMPIIFLFGVAFQMHIAIVGILFALAMMSIYGMIMELASKNNEEVRTDPAYPYFVFSFVVVLVMEYLGKLELISNFVRKLGYVI